MLALELKKKKKKKKKIMLDVQNVRANKNQRILLYYLSRWKNYSSIETKLSRFLNTFHFDARGLKINLSLPNYYIYIHILGENYLQLVVYILSKRRND